MYIVFFIILFVIFTVFSFLKKYLTSTALIDLIYSKFGWFGIVIGFSIVIGLCLIQNVYVKFLLTLFFIYLNLYVVLYLIFRYVENILGYFNKNIESDTKELIIFISMIISLFAGFVFAKGRYPIFKTKIAGPPKQQTTNTYIRHKSPVYTGQGCCSHHSGTCGCSDGSVRCCDGTISPSCGCY